VLQRPAETTHSFWTISLIDLLPNGETRQFVTEAEKFYNEGKYYLCLIECRKAIYTEIESSYVIDVFTAGENSWFAGAMCKAPDFTKSKSYVDEHVSDPFDYVQLDHGRVDAELLRDGIEPAVFWNIWRLTPPVYRPSYSLRLDDAQFAVKHDLERYDEEAAEPSAAYVLEHTIDILLKNVKTRSSFLKMEAGTNYMSKPKDGKPFKVYKKADKNSEVVGEVPGMAKLVTLKYRTPGLHGGSFWSVAFMDGLENDVGPGVDVTFSGYADENDLDLEWSSD